MSNFNNNYTLDIQIPEELEGVTDREEFLAARLVDLEERLKDNGAVESGVNYGDIEDEKVLGALSQVRDILGANSIVSQKIAKGKIFRLNNPPNINLAVIGNGNGYKFESEKILRVIPVHSYESDLLIKETPGVISLPKTLTTNAIIRADSRKEFVTLRGKDTYKGVSEGEDISSVEWAPAFYGGHPTLDLSKPLEEQQDLGRHQLRDILKSRGGINIDSDKITTLRYSAIFDNVDTNGLNVLYVFDSHFSEEEFVRMWESCNEKSHNAGLLFDNMDTLLQKMALGKPFELDGRNYTTSQFNVDTLANYNKINMR